MGGNLVGVENEKKKGSYTGSGDTTKINEAASKKRKNRRNGKEDVVSHVAVNWEPNQVRPGHTEKSKPCRQRHNVEEETKKKKERRG